MTKKVFSEITPEILDLANLCTSHKIDPSLYDKYEVKRGLRDISGKGVLTGLTEIGDIHAYDEIDGKTVPCEGRLYYRGYDLYDIVDGFISDDRFGFEETVYLLLFGYLPTSEELTNFRELLADYRSLPTYFVRDVIMKAPSRDMMNALSRSVLTLYSYDENAEDISIPNVLRQCIQLISIVPLLSVYSYQASRHFHENDSLYIHTPPKDLSLAESILYTLRPDKSYTALEAKILDLCLVIHAEHAIAASLGSLKGPKHGGANIKVAQMFDDMKKNVDDWSSKEEISDYLRKLLHKEAFDNSGLIYGMGHAVYSISDPRANILKKYVQILSKEKGMEKEFMLYSLVEELAPQIIADERKIYKGVSANVDFYSGLVYSMLGLPHELYTPLFAIARIAGWSAHRIEELMHSGKIIRPAYKNVAERTEYVPIDER